MGLYRCPDCGRRVSDAAVECPGCGRLLLMDTGDFPRPGRQGGCLKTGCGCLALLVLALALGSLVPAFRVEFPPRAPKPAATTPSAPDAVRPF